MTDMLNTYTWVPEANAFISDKLRRVSEIVNDYDPRLFIAPIPDAIRAGNPGKSHALVHEQRDGSVYVVRLLSEDEITEDLLVWLWTHDNEKTDVLGRIEALDAAKRAVELKKTLEEAEENKDIGKSILNSKLHTYRHNGKKYT